jgi:hypothetical protein
VWDLGGSEPELRAFVRCILKNAGGILVMVKG